MNTTQLFSYIDKKETYTKESIETLKETLEEFPYFQSAHILLLKSLYINETNNYNSQLKISGTYISDKAKLFQFINESIVEHFDSNKKSETKKEADEKIEKELSPEERIKALKEKNLQKRNNDKLKDAVKTKEIIKSTEKKEEKTNIQTKKEVINAEKRHSKIIDDFFKSSKTIKKAKVEKNKIEPVKKEVVEKTDPKLTAKSLFEENRRKKQLKKDITKPVEEDKKLIDKKEEHSKVLMDKKLAIKEKEIIKQIQKKEEPLKKNIEDINKTSKTEIKKEIVAKKDVKKVETKKPVIKEKKTTIATTVENEKDIEKVKKSSQNDAMTNIFSKIKAIKKEMKIDSPESDKKTIDINKREKSLRNKIIKGTSKSEDKKSILENDIFNETSEAIDPFKQRNKEIDKTKTIADKKEKNKLIPEKENTIQKKEEETIKEEHTTAKDLFNHHKKKKTLEAIKNDNKKSKGIKSYVEEYIEEKQKKDVNKDKSIVEEVNIVKEVSTITKEIPVEEVENTIDKNEKNKIETKPNKTESAADALLRKIALKKQKMKEEEKKEKSPENLKIKNKEVEEIKKDEIINKEELKTDKKTNIINESKEFEIDEVRKNNIKKIKEANNINTEKTEKKENKSKRSNNLIDKFINKSDNLERLAHKETKLKGDISVDSTRESDEIITESIADLYVDQKNFKKAISAYKKLILKFPEKKTYFAIQIKKVESFIK